MAQLWVDEIIYNGRPCQDRAPNEMITYDFLDSLKINYKRVDHSPAASACECKYVKEILGLEICKNLFIGNAQRTRLFMLTMKGDKQFKSSIIAPQVSSSRLSFAEDNLLFDCLNLTPGSVSVMGLIFDKNLRVQLLLDSDLLKDEYFGCHPCQNTSSLKIKMSDILDKFLPATGHSPQIIHI